MLEITTIQSAPLPTLTGLLPTEAFAPFSSDRGAMLLLSGGTGRDAAFSYICLAPAAFLFADRTEAWIEHGQKRIRVEDPLAVLDSVAGTVATDASAPGFRAGAVGYLSYDFRTRIENVPCRNPGAEGLPDLFFAFPGIVLAFNHAEQTWRSTSISWRIDREAIAAPGLKEVLKRAACRPSAPFPVIGADALTADVSEAEHVAAVEQTRRHIIDGDIYQANIARRFAVPIEGDPYPLFTAIFERNPAPFFAYLNCGDHQVLSSSPELLVRAEDRRIESKPIKGTTPRYADPEADRASRDTLSRSPKDAAELAMIVDLVRNDLGRVCTAGSVGVRDHREIQAFTNVYHTLSTVHGRLRDNAAPSDVIRALFPGGSITGCPKIRAMEIIDAIEKSRRHIYTGSIGYVAAGGDMMFNIAIRTALVHDGMLYFAVGGGIVFDSDGKAEYDETTHKAQTWLTVFRQGVPGNGADSRLSLHSKIEARRSNISSKDLTMLMVYMNGTLVSESDAQISIFDRGFQYGDGIFETIRAVDGQAEFLDEHLSRLRSSAADLKLAVPDTDWHACIGELLAANNLARDTARVKIILTRGVQPGLGLACTAPTVIITAQPQPTLKPPERIGIYPERRTDSLSRHKSLNYLFNLLARDWATQNHFDEAVLLDAEGYILECTASNLLVKRGSTLIKPRNNGLYLDGITMQHYLREQAAAGLTIREQALHPGDLQAEDEILISNAMIGVCRVTLVR